MHFKKILFLEKLIISFCGLGAEYSSETRHAVIIKMIIIMNDDYHQYYYYQ